MSFVRMFLDDITGLLVYFENEVLKRAHKNFSFLNGRWASTTLSGRYIYLSTPSSIGNYFLSAATEFFRSLPSAIFLFSSITNSQVCLNAVS